MLPKLIIFDYGETLAHEANYSSRNGFAAVLKYGCENPRHVDADFLLQEYQAAYHDLRDDGIRVGIELPNLNRWRWVFEMHDLRFTKSGSDLEEIFWDGAAPCTPTPGMPRLLALLREKGIKTGVISNMGFSGTALRQRLEKTFPDHAFDFVISSADYLLRKPEKRIFDLALHKAGCKADEAWFLGDNLRCDIFGSASAGLRPIYYSLDLGDAYREPQNVDALPEYLRINDWQELIDMIENNRTE